MLKVLFTASLAIFSTNLHAECTMEPIELEDVGSVKLSTDTVCGNAELGDMIRFGATLENGKIVSAEAIMIYPAGNSLVKLQCPLNKTSTNTFTTTEMPFEFSVKFVGKTKAVLTMDGTKINVKCVSN